MGKGIRKRKGRGGREREAFGVLLLEFGVVESAVSRALCADS